MKRTLIVAAMILAGFGTVNGGELKVQIPVTDYEQIQSRLDTLENENSRLKQEISSLESSVQPDFQPAVNAEPSEEMMSKVSNLENENDQLRREVESLQNSQTEASAPVITDDEINSRLTSLERENLRLNQKIKAYKDRGVRVVDNDRRSARQVYRDMSRGK